MSCHFRATSIGNEGHFGVMKGMLTKPSTDPDLHQRWSGINQTSMTIDFFLPR